jgi:HAD superfamily hydrolase (TIGR01509 family)
VRAGPATLRALIWDVDGTLAETERDGHLVAFNAAFAAADPPFGHWHWNDDAYRRWLAVPGGKERLHAAWRAADPASAAAPDAAQRVAALHRAKTAHYLRLVRAGAVALRPGVRRVLDGAQREGVILAIATTTTPDNVQELLDHTLGPGSSAHFACIAAGDIVPRKKPAPDVYRHVLAALGLDARDALALEDSAAGVAAATAAGLPTVLTRSAYTRDEVMPRDPALLADLDGLGDDAARGRPAAGTRFGADGPRRWSGVVTLAQLRAWHRAAQA